MSRVKILALIALFTFALGLALVGEALAGERENLIVIERNLHEIWHQQKFEVADEIVAENYVRHFPGGAKIQGRETYKAMVKGWMTAHPDTRWKMDQVIAKGDYVVVRYSGRGTHTGEGSLGPPTGKSWEATSIVIHGLRDGKMAEDWDVFSELSFMQQLGYKLVPPSEK